MKNLMPLWIIGMCPYFKDLKFSLGLKLRSSTSFFPITQPPPILLDGNRRYIRRCLNGLGDAGTEFENPERQGYLSYAHSTLGLGFFGSREQPELASLLQGPHGIRSSLLW